METTLPTEQEQTEFISAVKKLKFSYIKNNTEEVLVPVVCTPPPKPVIYIQVTPPKLAAISRFYSELSHLYSTASIYCSSCQRCAPSKLL